MILVVEGDKERDGVVSAIAMRAYHIKTNTQRQQLLLLVLLSSSTFSYIRWSLQNEENKTKAQDFIYRVSRQD